MRIEFNVAGVPQGKARPRVVHPAPGMSRAYTPRTTVVYENMVRWMFYETAGAEYQMPDASLMFPAGKPVKVTIAVYMVLPSSVSKKKKADMLSKKLRPLKKPDADNIAKIVLDALNGVAWKDDSQVASLTIEKYWSEINVTRIIIEEI